LFIDASYFGQAAGGTIGFTIQIFTLDFAEAGAIYKMGLLLGSLIKLEDRMKSTDVPEVYVILPLAYSLPSVSPAPTSKSESQSE